LTGNHNITVTSGQVTWIQDFRASAGT
jgi:hypothetical protein